jgi:8-oxo-dGTP diphosphatase
MPQRKANKKKQITVMVGLVVRDNTVLMVKRHEPEVEGAHLRWEFPGGKVDFGETPEQAIIREIKEETGVIARVKRLLPRTFTTNWDYPWGIQHTLLFGFECEFVSEEKRQKDHHVENVEWVRIDEVLKRDNLPGAKEFLESLSS